MNQKIDSDKIIKTRPKICLLINELKLGDVLFKSSDSKE